MPVLLQMVGKRLEEEKVRKMVEIVTEALKNPAWGLQHACSWVVPSDGPR